MRSAKNYGVGLSSASLKTNVKSWSNFPGNAWRIEGPDSRTPEASLISELSEATFREGSVKALNANANKKVLSEEFLEFRAVDIHQATGGVSPNIAPTAGAAPEVVYQ